VGRSPKQILLDLDAIDDPLGYYIGLFPSYSAPRSFIDCDKTPPNVKVWKQRKSAE
jgi:hypothetical protein